MLEAANGVALNAQEKIAPLSDLPEEMRAA